MFGTGNVWNRQCLELAMFGTGNVWNWQCLELAMFGTDEQTTLQIIFVGFVNLTVLLRCT